MTQYTHNNSLPYAARIGAITLRVRVFLKMGWMPTISLQSLNS